MKIKGIKPMYSGIITEYSQYETDMCYKDNKLIYATKGQPRDYQKVIAVGDSNSIIKVGDYVKVHWKNFMRMQHGDNSLINDTDMENKKVSFNPPIIEINGEPCLKLGIGDIEFACESVEEDDIEEFKESSLITPKQSIIDPTKGATVGNKKKLIL